MAKKVKDPNKKSLWAEFKEFINKGNAFMLAVGVVIGGAFNAIVTALVNILMSIATWGVPGGLKGLVTVLPALNDAQKGMDAAVGLGQKFEAGQLQELARALAVKTYGEVVVEANPNLIESVKTTILGKYTLHGLTYTYNMSAVIDWGTFINAILAFIIIAITLFIIVKVTVYLSKKREAAKAKLADKIEKKEEEPAEEAKAE